MDQFAPIVELNGISKQFDRPVGIIDRLTARAAGNRRPSTLQALGPINLSITEGEIVGLVGETGSGKSTLGRIVAGTLTPSQGALSFRGTSTINMTSKEARAFSQKVQMVYQNPMASLNPKMRVRELIAEAPVVHGIWKRDQIDAQLDELLALVGLGPMFKRRFPHQLSGGERQRVSIARALAIRPEVLVCDEAVSALDVAIQAQILNLFAKLRQELGLTYIFISHDLGAVHYLADRVAVMYLGQIVECAPTELLFSNPNHPYTRALVDGVTRMNMRRQTFEPIPGEVPSPFNRPSGCHFHPRCPNSFERCSLDFPILRKIAPDRLSACHLNEGITTETMPITERQESLFELSSSRSP